MNQRPDGLVPAARFHGEAAAHVTIPTISIVGRSGLLDFKFAALEPVIARGNPKTSGMVSGALSFEGRLTLVNTPQRHAAEYSVGISFGRGITFRFAMTGSGPEGGLHPSQGSAFGFSLLGAAASEPLLLVPDWQRLDPSGFAFLADLDGGELSVSSFLAEGSIQIARSVAV